MFDAVVVGSGYGGAIMATRLAGAGRSVCVLERGIAYPPGGFPRTPEAVESAVWLPAERRLGLFDVKELADVDVLTASGLGGGSLIGSGVLLAPDEDAFTGDGSPWPIRRDELAPHFDTARAALGGQPYPVDSPHHGSTSRARAMRSVSERLGASHELPPLTIAFGNEGVPPLPGEPLAEARPNLHRRRRYTCRLVGECSLGCNYGAKNSLDYTCLSTALAAGAELRAGCEVRDVRPRPGGGYTVRFVDHLTGPEGPRLRPPAMTVAARRVVLAAGALGSTGVLLRSARHLPGLSARLGSGFGGNGEQLALLIGCHAGATDDGPESDGEFIDAAHGPVTTSLLRMPASDGRAGPTINDVGYPDFLAWIAPLLARREAEARPHVRVLRRAYAALTADAPLSPGDWPPGTLATLINSGHAIRGRLRHAGNELKVSWEDRAEPGTSAGAAALAGQAVARALGGRLLAPHSAQRILCLHPLGGCPMGRTAAEGVVDPYGQAFRHPGLYVADGAIVPGPIGTAPALTIAALADRIATAILETRPEA